MTDSLGKTKASGHPLWVMKVPGLSTGLEMEDMRSLGPSHGHSSLPGALRGQLLGLRTRTPQLLWVFHSITGLAWVARSSLSTHLGSLPHAHIGQITGLSHSQGLSYRPWLGETDSGPEGPRDPKPPAWPGSDKAGRKICCLRVEGITHDRIPCPGEQPPLGTKE